MNGPEPDQVMRKRLGHVLIGAHVLDGLARLPSESVQTCITSPPYYGLRHYNTEPQIWGGEANCRHDWREIPEKKRDRDEPHLKQKQSTNAGSVTPLPETHLCTRCGAWCGELGLEPAPEMYIAHLVTIFREVRRILRPDGTLWLNLGDSYWGGKGQSGQASAERQAARQHLSINRSHHQIGGKGVTRPQDGKHPILKPKDMIGIPWRVALALQADGWWLRSDVIWHKPDVMPESVRDRPTKAHEYVFLLAKSKHYYYDADAIREPHQDASFLRQQRAVLQHKYREGAPGQTEHTFLRSRPHAKGRRSAQEALDEGHGLHPLGRNKRTVWTLPTTSYKGAHFATFPTALIEPCIRAGTPIDGWVLDPFFGSGTTGEVASRLGRWFAGIELGSVYIGLAKERLFKAWEAEKRAGSLKELPALFIWNESGGRAKPC